MPEPIYNNEVKKSVSLTEDFVLISIMAIGFLGSVAIYVFSYSVPPIVVAILMGSAVSALVYRFLGGIPQKTAFTLGAVQLGGSMAALVGCAYFINIELDKQTGDMNDLFNPHFENWFAISKSRPVPVEVSVTNMGILPAPENDMFSGISLNIDTTARPYAVYANNDKSFILGTLSTELLISLPWQVAIGKGLEHFLVTERLSADSSGINLDPLPFVLNTGAYGGEYSRYSLFDADGNNIHSGSIYRKQTEFVHWQGCDFIVAVVEVNHLPQSGKAYAKFAIGELKSEVSLK